MSLLARKFFALKNRYYPDGMNGYSPADKDELYSDKDSESAENDPALVHSRPKPQRVSFLWPFISTISVLAWFVLLAAYLNKQPTDSQCKRQMDVYSPLLDAVEYEKRNFNNAFAHDTLYRGPPTQELEDSWDKLWRYGGVKIPKEKMQELDRSPDGDFRPTEDGTGYHALIEMFHQLHCLNIIRQYTWKDYYDRHADRVEKPIVLIDSEIGARMHTDHCIEALRISLMCHGDVTPFMVRVDPGSPVGFEADFSPYHKCVKWDPLVQWMKENSFDSLDPHADNH